MNKTLSAGFAAAFATCLVAVAAHAAPPRGPWVADKGNTWGWQLMTSQERLEHQNKMRSFKTYEECKAYLEEHHKQMEARAKEKGVTLPSRKPGMYGCDNMKARGYFQ